jgi:hypothetical protein
VSAEAPRHPEHIDGLVDKPAYKRALEIVSVSGFLLAFGSGLVRVAPHAGAQVGAMCVSALTALLLADVISGVVHWAADSWGSSDLPVLGPLLLRPFRAHHVDPASITRHDFWETNGHNALVTLPLPLIAQALPLETALGARGAVFLLFLALPLFLTNQVHKLAHEQDPGSLARLLQRAGLLLRPEDHARHHTRPYTRSYCITLGWMNPLLDALRVFPRVERAITALTGAHPREEDARLARAASDGTPATGDAA